jgi:hypothetical protein
MLRRVLAEPVSLGLSMHEAALLLVVVGTALVIDAYWWLLI